MFTNRIRFCSQMFSCEINIVSSIQCFQIITLFKKTFDVQKLPIHDRLTIVNLWSGHDQFQFRITIFILHTLFESILLHIHMSNIIMLAMVAKIIIISKSTHYQSPTIEWYSVPSTKTYSFRISIVKLKITMGAVAPLSFWQSCISLLVWQMPAYISVY